MKKIVFLHSHTPPLPICSQLCVETIVMLSLIVEHDGGKCFWNQVIDVDQLVHHANDLFLQRQVCFHSYVCLYELHSVIFWGVLKPSPKPHLPERNERRHRFAYHSNLFRRHQWQLLWLRSQRQVWHHVAYLPQHRAMSHAALQGGRQLGLYRAIKWWSKGCSSTIGCVGIVV